MSEEDEISRLRNELDNSQRRLKVVGIIGAVLIVILSLGWFASYRALLEKNEFEFYYAARCKQRYGVDDLEEYLDRWQWSEGAYVKDKFDCSEMSAYVEWRLENEGYRTLIVVGGSPSEPQAQHAWLLVETSSGKYMPVEATQFALVKWDSQYFHQYFEYDHSFETIADALKYDYDGFDWWES